MHIERTTVSDKIDRKAVVEILIADYPEMDQESKFVHLRVQVESDANPLFSALQRAALHRAQEILNEQMKALESPSN